MKQRTLRSAKGGPMPPQNERNFRLKRFSLDRPLLLKHPDWRLIPETGSEWSIRPLAGTRGDLYRADILIHKREAALTTEPSPEAFSRKRLSMKSWSYLPFPNMIRAHIKGPSPQKKKRGRIRKKRVFWQPSSDPDVVAYRLYWVFDGHVDYESDCVEIGKVTEVTLPDDLPSFPRRKGRLELGVTALNAGGNESDMLKIAFWSDFSLPEPPSSLSVRN